MSDLKQKIEAARKAIDEVFSDQSVTKQETYEALGELEAYTQSCMESIEDTDDDVEEEDEDYDDDDDEDE